jgi:hypothetical protein
MMHFRPEFRAVELVWAGAQYRAAVCKAKSSDYSYFLVQLEILHTFSDFDNFWNFFFLAKEFVGSVDTTPSVTISVAVKLGLAAFAEAPLYGTCISCTEK